MTFSRWITNARQRWADRGRLARDPLLNSIISASGDIYARLDFKDHIAKEGADSMAGQMLQRIRTILDSEDRLRECRKQLHICISEFARYQVLNISREPEPDVTGLRGMQGISGELEPHLLDIVNADDHLKVSVLGDLEDPTDKMIRDLVILLYQRGYWFAHSMNACRVALGDYHCEANKDWFKPFLHAMCVWRESEYRKLLGLKPAIKGDEYQVTALAYLGFSNIVLSGAPDPLASWKQQLRELFENGTLNPPY